MLFIDNCLRVFFKRYLVAFCLVPSFLLALDYRVEFEGLEDKKTEKAIESVSQLMLLRKRPPASLNALKYRADADIPILLKVLQAHGFYDAKVNIEIIPRGQAAEVVVFIQPGPVYTIESYDIQIECSEGTVCCPIGLKKIGIRLGSSARMETLLNAELKTLSVLGECGYPLAQVKDRKIIVDGKTKTVRVELFVESLPRCFFGKTTLFGENQVSPRFIERKISWKEGDPYNSALVEETQNALINSGLFNSVLITHEPSPTGEHQLPMKIEVTETKYQSINVGVSYQTVFGPGITGGWEHRNLAGMGRKLHFQADATLISQTGILSYLHPDLLDTGGDLILEGAAEHETLFAYSMRSYSESNRLDSHYGKRIRFSVGLQGERLFVTASKANGEYWLVEAPLYVRFSTANSLLNPTKGITLDSSIVPTANIGNTTTYYAMQYLSESTYLPLTKNHNVVLAQQITLGIGWYGPFDQIPLPKRFLGGSEQDLRGYRYKTVSPLVGTKPIGGGSAIYGTMELRLKISSTIGLVPFFDLGNVYSNWLPTFNGKWLKSIGLGFRYFTFMGPFRLDLAFPLNRRKGIDPVYKILVSMGQTF